MMTLAYWMVLVAGLLPYGFAVAAKSARGYNNHAPRDFLQKLDGWRKRANAVQLNSFETFPFFAAAVVIAHLAGGVQQTVNYLAVGFVVSRVIYGACYLADIAAIRSIVWTVGLGCIIGLFFVGI